MSKKKNKSAKTETEASVSPVEVVAQEEFTPAVVETPVIETIVVKTPVIEKPAKKVPKPVEVAPEPVILSMTLQDAANRYISGYKKHWLVPLKQHAVNQGLNPDAASSSEVWKQSFLSWGAIIK